LEEISDFSDELTAPISFHPKDEGSNSLLNISSFFHNNRAPYLTLRLQDDVGMAIS
jgi:hypothetical protein